jgi:hypothetical protein
VSKPPDEHSVQEEFTKWKKQDNEREKHTISYSLSHSLFWPETTNEGNICNTQTHTLFSLQDYIHPILALLITSNELIMMRKYKASLTLSGDPLFERSNDDHDSVCGIAVCR